MKYSMNTYNFSTKSQEVIEQVDKEFTVALVVGSPKSGYSSGFDIEIYDERPVHEIHVHVEHIKENKIRS